MFWDNLVSLCNERGTSPSAVCSALGLSNSASVKWKRGSVPQDRTLLKIADYFGVTIKDLVADNDKQDLAGNIRAEETIYFIPVYESVSAGFGTLARSDIVTRMPCTFRSEIEAEQTLGVRVRGDSMYPKIEDGDTVIVRRQNSIDSGDIGVVIVDGDEGFVKRVEYGADWIHLISINPMYPTMKFKGEEVLRVQVVGRVTRIIKDV